MRMQQYVTGTLQQRLSVINYLPTLGVLEDIY